MRQIFCSWLLGGMMVLLTLIACVKFDDPQFTSRHLPDQKSFKVSVPDSDSHPKLKTSYTADELEAFGVETIKSSYFDRAMNYKDSRLRVISLSRLVDQFHVGGDVDAILLDCFDDYQGIISLEEVRRYDLRLATAIQLQPEFKAPDWLNPLLIVVPDGNSAPYQERFVAGNIRELQFVRLDDYYAPLKEISRTAPEREAGFQVFKDNCVFCHSLKGIGGNKGAKFILTYSFSQEAERERFKASFEAFHGIDSPIRQYIAQFVDEKMLDEIIRFLQDRRLVQ